MDIFIHHVMKHNTLPVQLVHINDIKNI